jgi:hypothetical protein
MLEASLSNLILCFEGCFCSLIISLINLLASSPLSVGVASIGFAMINIMLLVVYKLNWLLFENPLRFSDIQKSVIFEYFRKIFKKVEKIN